MPPKGFSSVSSFFSFGQQLRDLVAAESRADAADVNQMTATIHADQQRAEVPRRFASSHR